MLKPLIKIIKKTVVLLDKYGLTALGIVTTLLACIAIASRVNQDASVCNAMIEVLFIPDEHPANQFERWFRIVFKFMLGWAGVRVYMSTAGLTFDTFLACYLTKEHILIATGSSSAKDQADTNVALAIDLAISLRAKNEHVVICINTVNDTDRERLWSSGVTVVNEKIHVSDILKLCSGHKAKMLIAMRDDHYENIALARALVASDAKSEPTLCKILLENQTIKIEEYFEPQTMHRIRAFSVADLVAKDLLLNYPPDACIDPTTNERAHLLLIGFGRIGESVIIQLAQFGRYANGLNPRITVVDRGAHNKLDALKKKFPKISRFVDIVAIERKIEHVTEDDINTWALDPVPLSMIYITTPNEIDNLRLARMILKKIEKAGDQIESVTDTLPKVRASDSLLDHRLKVVAVDPPGGFVMKDLVKDSEYKERLSLLSVTRTNQQSDRHAAHFLLYLDDDLGKIIHDSWCSVERRIKEQRGDGKYETSADDDSWKNIRERDRNSSRQAGDPVFLDIKLRAIGYDFRKTLESIPTLSNKQEEVLILLEHRRYVAERTLHSDKIGNFDREKSELLLREQIRYLNESNILPNLRSESSS